MKNGLFKIPYDYDAIKLKTLYSNPILENYTNSEVQTTNSKLVLGEIKFPELPEDRPYTMSSFVTSIDGKIAFPDAPEGPFIAKKNFLDPNGANTDFWILNLMRANADGIIIGAGTMQQEPDMTAHVFDEELEDRRIEIGLKPIPYNIVSSLDGTDIPFNHILFDGVVPVMINTSEKGYEVVKENLKKEYFTIKISKGEEFDKVAVKNLFEANKNKIPVIVTGNGRFTDTDDLFKVLKTIGVDKLLVESPSYVHYLITEGKLDEMILNYSAVYIGGKAVSLGNSMTSFTSENHPHTEILSLYMHSPSFLYFRHKLNYEYYKK